MHTPYISLSILHVHQLPSGMERSDVEPFEWLCCVYDDGFPGAPAMQEILRGQADAADRLGQVSGEVNSLLSS